MSNTTSLEQQLQKLSMVLANLQGSIAENTEAILNPIGSALSWPLDGIYFTEFRSFVDGQDVVHGTGTTVIDSGHVTGGDAAFEWHGQLTSTSHTMFLPLSVNLESTNPSMISIFLGVHNYILNISIPLPLVYVNDYNLPWIEVFGTVEGSPNKMVKIRLRKV